MTDKLEMPLEQFAEAVAKENARLTGCLKASNEKQEQFEREWYLAKDRIEELEGEIERLTKKCDMQAMILRRLTPENYPDVLFIHGTLGDKDQNNMPEKLLIIPAYGVDFSYIYVRTEKTTGPEW